MHHQGFEQRIIGEDVFGFIEMIAEVSVSPDAFVDGLGHRVDPASETGNAERRCEVVVVTSGEEGELMFEIEEAVDEN